jgi:hypothetical protein
VAVVQRLLAAGSAQASELTGTLMGSNPMHAVAYRQIGGDHIAHMLHDTNKSWIKAQDQ